MNNVLIFGAGSLGVYLGIKLQAAGFDVVLFGRKKASQIDGFVQMGDVEYLMPPLIQDITELEGRSYDYIFFTTKLYDSCRAIDEIIAHNVEAQHYVAIQNGLIENEQEFYHKLLDQGKPLSTLTVFNGYNLTDQTISVSENALGWVAGDSDVERIIVQNLRKAGIPIVTNKNFDAVKAEKLLLNNSINAISAIHEKTVGEVLSDEHLLSLLTTSIEEGYEVLRGSYELRALGEIRRDILRTLRRISQHYTSMYQDIITGRPTEIEFMNGFICRMGQEKGIPTPVNCALYNQVVALSQKI